MVLKSLRRSLDLQTSHNSNFREQIRQKSKERNFITRELSKYKSAFTKTPEKAISKQQNPKEKGPGRKESF